MCSTSPRPTAVAATASRPASPPTSPSTRPSTASARRADPGAGAGGRDTTVIDGLLVVDKPAGWTSHDVVAKLRGATRQRRGGHAGTLDTDATGVPLAGLGRGT